MDDFFTTDNRSKEASKLQQHLALLKEEYVKLQTQYNDIEKKYAVLNATSGNTSESSYVSRLLKTVNELHENPMLRLVFLSA